MVSIVEVISPPMTTVANGRCTSAPAPDEIAIGRKPMAAAAAVSITGLKRSDVPFFTSSSIFFIPVSFRCFRCSISTIPLSTAIPNKAMNPTPAEILKGIPRIHNATIPPTTDKGTAVKISMVSFRDLNAKWRKIKIIASAMGTANTKRLVAFCRFSNCPP